MKLDFDSIPEDKRNQVVALAFLLELELTRGSKTEDENLQLFLDYAKEVRE